LSVKNVDKQTEKPEKENSTVQPEINSFTRKTENWTISYLDLRGKDDDETKENINQWLTGYEALWTASMLGINGLAGFGGFAIAKKVLQWGNITNEFDEYQELYQSQVRLLSSKDLTEATLLRNALAQNLTTGQKWKKVYDDFDKFAEQSVGMTLDEMRKEFVQKAEFHNAVNFVDISGRRWQPKNYANMWSRTRSREIEDIIMSDEMGTLGLDVVLINNVSTVTPICLQFENKFFSLDGTTPGLPILRI
jgi:hypothetical protein